MVITSEEKKAFFSSLSEAFPHLSQITIERLYIFCELLVRYNDEYDLSRLKKFSDIIIKHFIDSIIVGTLIELPESLLDIGTGAGFPGIPLKIVHPDLKLILAEPRPMRVKFMNMVIKELSLSCVSVFSHKVNEKMYFPVSGVITRAFESTPATLERCVYFLPHNGSIILLKGPGVDAEMEEIPKEISDHYHLKTDLPYKLPKTSHERRLLVYKKTSSLIKRFYQISELPELTVGITIESSDNKRYKELKKAILTGPGKSRLAVISGEKTITDNYQIIRDTIFCGVIYDGYCEKSSKQNSIIAELDRSGKLILLKKSLYNELDIGINRQLLLFKKINDFNCLENIDISRPILLVPFQDPANTGSVIRSAVAFGITQIVITAEGCHPFHHKSIRASGGAVFNTDFYKGLSLSDSVDFFVRQGVTPVALDSAGTPLSDFSFPKKFVIIPGIEGPGLPEGLRQYSVSIPMTDMVESLNASISTSLLLYEYFKTL